DSGSNSWEFLVEVLQRLQGLPLDFSDEESALTWIRHQMLRFADQARARLAASERHGGVLDRSARKFTRRTAQVLGRRDPRLPFRAVLFGIETALLDAAARTLRISLVQLLGPVRQAVPTAMRLTVGNEREKAMDMLRHWQHDNPGRVPAWLNFEARLEPTAAKVLVDQVVAGVTSGELPRQVVLEQ